MSYIRFPSVINSSVQKGRTFSPQVSKANDIINFPILGDCDFQSLVRLKNLMVLFTSTEQVGRRSKGCNDWEKSLYPFTLLKKNVFNGFFFFLPAYFVVPLLKNFNPTLEWRWFTIILRPPNSQRSITTIQLRLSDSDVSELDVPDIWPRQTSYLSSSFHGNKSTWLFWPTFSFYKKKYIIFFVYNKYPPTHIIQSGSTLTGYPFVGFKVNHMSMNSTYICICGFFFFSKLN